ncbi:TetR/AcrR family transcriptional regulator [Streptomyces sp. NPDC008121]|uniref:TetR/AcrR family transcriptional regulator n=1 Tax=Streptomyces sp. NPDC008121 TaxID=3364809 RepID=UPI0036E9C106
MDTRDRRTLIADAAITTVARAGLRGLTHRAVDAAADLPAGSTSYYFRNRTALITACYERLLQLDLLDVGDAEWTPADRGQAAEALAVMLHRWLTTGRERQLARIELTIEAARQPSLQGSLADAGRRGRARAAVILAELGARDPESAATLLVAWTEGILHDYLVGAMASVRPAPDARALVSVARRMLDAALAPEPAP